MAQSVLAAANGGLPSDLKDETKSESGTRVVLEVPLVVQAADKKIAKLVYETKSASDDSVFLEVPLMVQATTTKIAQPISAADGSS